MQLKQRLFEPLQTRVDYFLTFYHNVHNSYGRAAILVDKVEFAHFQWINNTKQESDVYHQYLIDGVWNFEDEELNKKWNENCILAEHNFINAILAFLNMDIQDALKSTDPIIKILAILDKRVGKRSLEKVKYDYLNQPDWVKQFYLLRYSVNENKQDCCPIIYHQEIPNWLIDFASVKEMTRLYDIGMNCGVQYTSYPLFKELTTYSRYQHSIGVALIVYHFTNDITQSLAALFHDIASPVFAHTIDFLKGDYLKQEETENGTAQIILESKQVQNLCKKYKVDISKITDYHCYPIADNDSPRLSADRLEYTLGNMIRFKFANKGQAQSFYDNLVVLQNETKQEELSFNSLELAKQFSNIALKCSHVYVCDADRYSMQFLSEIIGKALKNNVIQINDLQTEEHKIINKLCANKEFKELWNHYCSQSETYVSNSQDLNARIIYAKKRHIDVFTSSAKRYSELDEQFKNDLLEFLNQSQEYFVSSK